ncbi:MAG: sulfur carrier protein ThiS [Planctomycetota bacterium]
MRIVLNGEAREVTEGTTVGALLRDTVRDRSRIAVERNREIVPRAAYDEVVVAEGDEVEVVTLVGGG